MWPRSRGRNSGRRGVIKHRGAPSGRSFQGGSFHGASRGFYNKPPRPYGKPYDQSWPKKFERPRTFHKGVIERLNEKEIGVTEYIRDLEGFNGIIKARYSDFQVNEIDKDGLTAKLTDLSVPEDLKLGIYFSLNVIRVNLQFF